MSLLAWRPGRRADAQALKAFCCTERAHNVRRPHGWEVSHPREWELRVQSIIRASMSPVGGSGRTNLLGWDRDRLVGVVSYREDTTGGYTVDVLAVARDYRRRGGGWATEALTTALDLMMGDAAERGLSVITVAAIIDERNKSAQHLAQSHRFTHTDQREDGYQVWAAEFSVDPDLASER